MPRFTKRMRTRSPSRTMRGVVAGPACPLNNSQLNSMFMVLGTVLFGSTAYSGHLLHCHVRVVEKSTCLMDVELIDEPSARLHRWLADAGHTVVLDGVFKAMPVHGSRLR